MYGGHIQATPSGDPGDPHSARVTRSYASTAIDTAVWTARRRPVRSRHRQASVSLEAYHSCVKSGNAVLVVGVAFALASVSAGPAQAAKWREYGDQAHGCVTLRYERGEPEHADTFISTSGGGDYRLGVELSRAGRGYWSDDGGSGFVIKAMQRKARVSFTRYGERGSFVRLPAISRSQWNSLCPAPT